MPQDLPTLAFSILNVSRNTLSIHLRFMNLAISRLRWLSIPDAVREMAMLQPLWNLACDMAVEGVINDLNLPMLTNAQAAG